jgi:predicted ArsR family transcriptional regulator
MSQQSIEALKKANEIRLSRAAVKRHIEQLPTYESREAVAEIIREPGDLWGTAHLDYVLQMAHRTGQGFARKVSRRSGVIDPRRKLQALTDRQRLAIIAEIHQIRRKK